MFGERSVVTALAIAAIGAAIGCTVEGKKDVAKTAVNAMSAEDRRESFEATARMLDEDPKLVDELYAVVHQHRPTMAQFLANATRDLKEPWLADLTASLLVRHPDSVEQMLVSSIDAISKEPKARMAMDRAISKRSEKTVDILTDDATTLGRVVSSSMTIIEKKPRARDNVLAAARQQRKQVIAFVKSDPELAKEMTEELLREAVKDKPALEKLLRATGAIDEDAPSKAKR